MLPDELNTLSTRSRYLHGHKYVLPVAAWIRQSGQTTVTVGEVMVGLGGHIDRPRVIEALAKLAAFDALTELPRGPQRNAPRYFERRPNRYWDLVEVYVAEVEARPPESEPEAS